MATRAARACAYHRWGIHDNLRRVLPANVDAVVDLDAVRPQSVFHVIRDVGAVDDADMLRTFNMGVVWSRRRTLARGSDHGTPP